VAGNDQGWGRGGRDKGSDGIVTVENSLERAGKKTEKGFGTTNKQKNVQVPKKTFRRCALNPSKKDARAVTGGGKVGEGKRVAGVVLRYSKPMLKVSWAWTSQSSLWSPLARLRAGTEKKSYNPETSESCFMLGGMRSKKSCKTRSGGGGNPVWVRASVWGKEKRDSKWANGESRAGGLTAKKSFLKKQVVKKGRKNAKVLNGKSFQEGVLLGPRKENDRMTWKKKKSKSSKES